METANLTTEERRLKRIAQLKAKLQKETARQNELERKRRNGQLIAFGVFFEQWFKNANPEEKTNIISLVKNHLKDRNLERALEGMKRLAEDA
uniref:Mobilization protein n=1 Tax=uncultured prokaryote TaxID=198431 RepID=A0A0H5QC24_9ZZZZ|nr:unnamed protein product [uncultured bacterium]CRY93697.1 hypothetical protein [uncultured prokaryote]